MRGNSKPDTSPFFGPFPQKWIVLDSHSPAHIDFLKNWSVASTKFGVDDGFVVVAAEDDATVSLITDVGTVQKIERPSALMDSISLSADFDGKVPGEKTADLPNHASRGDWGSVEHVTKTSARICTPCFLLPRGVAMFQGTGEQMPEECNVSYDRVLFSVTASVEVSLGTKLAQVEGDIDLTMLRFCAFVSLSQSCCVHFTIIPTHSRWLKVATK